MAKNSQKINIEKEEQLLEEVRNPFLRSSKVTRSPTAATRSLPPTPKPEVEAVVATKDHDQATGGETFAGVVKTSSPTAPFRDAKGEASGEGDGEMEVEAIPPECPLPAVSGIPPKRSPLRPVFEVGVLRRQQDDADDEEGRILGKITDLVGAMLKVLKVQKNVNNTIKEGLPKVESYLAEIRQCRQVRVKAKRQERDSVNRVVPPKQAEAKASSRKRARSSPSGGPGLTGPVGWGSVAKATQTTPVRPGPAALKPPASSGGGSSAPTPARNSGKGSEVGTPAAGEWRSQLSRKERRKLRRQEMAAKKAPAAVRGGEGRPKAPTPPPKPVASQTKGAIRANKKKKAKMKPRTEAILIRPSTGRSFAEVLRDLKAGTKPEDSATEVKAIRCTRAGDVLVELGASGDRARFASEVRRAVGEKGSVKELEPKASVEIRDIDGLRRRGGGSHHKGRARASG